MHIRTTIVAAIASLSFAGTGLGQFWTPASTSSFTATGGVSNDYFGTSVAIDGDTCVIGALGTNSNTGSAYVFTNTGGTWNQAAELNGGTIADYFGNSVAIDGSTCVIGAWATNSNTGSAYVFTNTGGIWSQVAELTATGGASILFGYSVAIDGDTCVIGAYGTNSGAGSAYVFTNTDGTWSQVAELTATGGASFDNFGVSVDLDGSTCVIGAPNGNSGTGSAYVFTNTGGTWNQAAELTATGGASSDNFGYSVAIDGSTCVIGAPGTDSGAGSAYVFEYVDTLNEWIQWGPALTATGVASGDRFGTSVAIDGSTCVIGAWGTNSNTGSAYVYGSGRAATGACCYDGLCFSITESECNAVGGSFTAEACSADTACPTPCSSDIDNDGDIDIQDLLQMLTDWGACP